MTEPKSKCCSQPAIWGKKMDSKECAYFCGGDKGCGHWCEVEDAVLENEQAEIFRLMENARKEERERIKMLIVKECNIARSENEPTSRLTSLWNKIDEHVG